MKYVTDHFTLEMIKEPTYTLIPKTLKKGIFKKSVKKAKSSINSKLIAHMLHKPQKNQKLNLKKGDEVYVITSDFGRQHSCEYTHQKKFRFEVMTIN